MKNNEKEICLLMVVCLAWGLMIGWFVGNKHGEKRVLSGHADYHFVTNSVTTTKIDFVGNEGK